MTFLEILSLLFLAIFLPIPISWIIIHPTINLWRKIGKYSHCIIRIILWLIFAFIIFKYRNYLLVNQVSFTIFPFIAAILAIIFSLYLDKKRSEVFNIKQLFGFPEIMPDKYKQKLVTSGIYSKIRHPRYLGYIFFSWGIALLTRFLITYAAALYMTFSLYILMILEEHELKQRFGEAYEEYCRKVPRLWPKW